MSYGKCRVSQSERWEPRADVPSHYVEKPELRAQGAQKMKRILREWPRCEYGGEIELNHYIDGRAYWCCSRCN